MDKLNIPKQPASPLVIGQEALKFVESLEDRLSYISVIRIDDTSISVLGSNSKTGLYHEIVRYASLREDKYFSFKDPEIFGAISASFLTFGLYTFTENMRRRKRQYKDYQQKVKQYEEANEKEILEKINKIKVYQGDVKEAEKELGHLERVDTGSADTFLKEPLASNLESSRTYFLRIRAYQLGADAILHYVQDRNVCMGTPVRKKKD